GVVGLILAVESNRAGARVQEADDHVDGRALARSVRPEISEDFSSVHREADAVNGEQRAVALRQSARFEHVSFVSSVTVTSQAATCMPIRTAVRGHVKKSGRRLWICKSGIIESRRTT